MTLPCTRCQHLRTVKNGRSRHGHQRYSCLSCKATFGETDHRRIDDEKRRSALDHYLEGIGLRATERLVGVSHNSVMNWVRQEVAGKALERVDAADIRVVEADELWTYVEQKKRQPGCGGLLIELPADLLGGRWVIATPVRPQYWVRRFLGALKSLTPATSGATTTDSSRMGDTSKARRTPTRSKA
jgi:transposase-like protein